MHQSVPMFSSIRYVPEASLGPSPVGMETNSLMELTEEPRTQWGLRSSQALQLSCAPSDLELPLNRVPACCAQPTCPLVRAQPRCPQTQQIVIPPSEPSAGPLPICGVFPFTPSQASWKVRDVKRPQAPARSPLGHLAGPAPASELDTALGVPGTLFE